MDYSSYSLVVQFVDEVLARKDPYNHHGISVDNMSAMIANSLNLNQEQMDLLSTAARLHDVGKILLRDDLINHARLLSEMEYFFVKTHVNLGYDLMISLGYDLQLCEIIHSHHEHYDGSGYPRGLKGDKIHLFARIICIADSWVSMVNDRAYRKAKTEESALEEMNRCQSWFDPYLYAIFLDIIRAHR